MKKKCVICGFDKKIHKHHIMKRKDMGSDSEENIVYLCLNHHWIADFGEDKDRKEILKKIIEITGKEGRLIDKDKQKFLEEKCKVLAEESLGKIDDEFWKGHKETSNFVSTRNWLLGIGCPNDFSRCLNQKAEILLLIKKLENSLPSCPINRIT